MKLLTVLGSTGSIGLQALDVVRQHPDRFSVFAIAGGRRTELLLEQAHAFHPKFVGSIVPLDETQLPAGTTAIVGNDAAERIAAMPEPDAIVHGISGISALKPLLAALKAGKRVALANKESIVCGHIPVNHAISAFGGEILPVDSEQSAIFQCLQSGRRADIDRVLLTASGGPFWEKSLSELEHVTPEQALCHPTWRMGKKITIDSATLFNKGLEVIEAAYLFDLKPDQIEVVVHPQSIVHSAVSFSDGTVMVNAANPDMRVAIQYALTYPERIPSGCRRLSFSDVAGLTFAPAELTRFSALRLAYQALREGGTSPAVYNGANEAAVELFILRKIRFLDIERAVSEALSVVPSVPADLPEAIFDADRRAREAVLRYFA